MDANIQIAQVMHFLAFSCIGPAKDSQSVRISELNKEKSSLVTYTTIQPLELVESQYDKYAIMTQFKFKYYTDK